MKVNLGADDWFKPQPCSMVDELDDTKSFSAPDKTAISLMIPIVMISLEKSQQHELTQAICFRVTEKKRLLINDPKHFAVAMRASCNSFVETGVPTALCFGDKSLWPKGPVWKVGPSPERKRNRNRLGTYPLLRVAEALRPYLVSSCPCILQCFILCRRPGRC